MKSTVKKTRKERLKTPISVASLLSLFVATVAYLLGWPFYGYLIDISAPLCVIALYLNIAQKKNAKVTVLVMLLTLVSSCFGGCFRVPNVHAAIYQGHGYISWIFPMPEAWAMVDTDASMLSFKWSCSDAILVPWPGIWFPLTSGISIIDSNSTVFDSYPYGIHSSGELWLNYSGHDTWITFRIVICYQLIVPGIGFLQTDIRITFYVGHAPPSPPPPEPPSEPVVLDIVSRAGGVTNEPAGTYQLSVNTTLTIQTIPGIAYGYPTMFYKWMLTGPGVYQEFRENPLTFCFDKAGNWTLTPVFCIVLVWEDYDRYFDSNCIYCYHWCDIDYYDAEGGEIIDQRHFKAVCPTEFNWRPQ